jgi:co-chaperonin GroES (HSP10)
MQALNSFLVQLETNVKDTIETDSGLKLYIDTRFEGSEFDNRITGGPVVGVPARYKTDVRVGDTIYFHHLVVLNKGQLMPGTDDVYMVDYHPDIVTNNQAFAYKSAKSGHIYTLAGWALVSHMDQDEEVQSELIELVKLKDTEVTKGVLAFDVPELDLKSGAVVGFKKNRDYKVEIDGKDYYRIAISQLLYEIQDS